MEKKFGKARGGKVWVVDVKFGKVGGGKVWVVDVPTMLYGAPKVSVKFDEATRTATIYAPTADGGQAVVPVDRENLRSLVQVITGWPL